MIELIESVWCWKCATFGLFMVFTWLRTMDARRHQRDRHILEDKLEEQGRMMDHLQGEVRNHRLEIDEHRRALGLPPRFEEVKVTKALPEPSELVPPQEDGSEVQITRTAPSLGGPTAPIGVPGFDDV